MTAIRAARPTDLDSLYAISLATGLAGGDASHLYADPRLMGHIYVAPYALLEPALALVVEDAAGVAGFAVGALDTAAWEDRLEQAWWPALRQRHAPPQEPDACRWNPDERRLFMIHHPSRTPEPVARAWPAHLHLNLLPRLQGHGVGTALFAQWMAVAGARATHVAINRDNLRAVAFWDKMGFAALDVASPGRTVWRGRA
jgi:GNAT superfamily N-acetyltransferase